MTNPLILIRSEIVNIAILLFLIFYNRLCRQYESGKNYFLPFALTCLSHVVFALITEITVNSDTVSPLVNYLCHIIFYATSLLYIITYFKYILSLVFPKRKTKRFMIPLYTLCAILVPLFFLTDIRYISGNGTKYSMGISVAVCYAIAFLVYIFSDILFIYFRKNIAKDIFIAILPISVVTMGLLLIQCFIPEFLFSGSAITISVISVFFAIENPLAKFEHAAFIDLKTGVYNRNRYEFDVSNLDKTEEKISIAIFDMNGLKKINDNYGHIAGDFYIIEAAEILTRNLTSVWNLYRVGGDEFAALYKDADMAKVEQEISNVLLDCQSLSKTLEEELSISHGLVTKGDDEKYVEAVNRADLKMYEDKKNYYSTRGKDRRTL